MTLFSQALVDGILLGATYAVMTLGLTIIYNITGLINFAHGDFMMLGMFGVLSLYGAVGLSPYLSVFVVAPVLFIIGVLLYRFVMRRVIDRNVLMVVQLTLGLMFIMQNGLLIGYGGEYQRLQAPISSAQIPIGDNFLLRTPLLIAFLVSIVLAGLFYLGLSRTDFGRSVRAIHQDEEGAALVGINIEWVRSITFGLALAVLGIAGVLIVPSVPVHPVSGLHYTLLALVIFILGGMTNFLGTLLGGLLVGVSESLGAVYFSGTVGQMVPFILVGILILIRPKGLLAK